LVAQVAAQVLEAGGNAIDAGVAGGLASNVVQSDMANLGGIAPILVRTSGSEEVWSIAGVGTWGQEVSLAAFRERFGDDMPPGGSSAVVPGAPDAWLTALKRFGTWSFGDVAAPAIELASEGFVLDQRTAIALEILGRGFRHWDSSRSIYWPKDRAPRAGEWLQQTDLAALLQSMVDAEKGGDRDQAIENARNVFYRGAPAEQMVESVRSAGGWLSLQDLAGFRCEVSLAPSFSFRGYRVHTTSTWSQGPVLLQALAILDNVDLHGMGHNSANYIHYLSEALKLAFSDREQYYGDPRFVDVDLDWLLSEDHTAELLALIRENAALPSLPTIRREQPQQDPGSKRFDTTYLCVVDGAGNAFSATPSDTLDGGPIVPGLGILVSPRGVQNWLESDHPSALAPGKRPRITPAPALAIGDDHDSEPMVFAFGGSGGDSIIQAMLQAFLNRVAFEMTPQQAVEAPRVATFSFPDSFFPHHNVPTRLSLEARIAEPIRQELEARGHRLYVWPGYEFDAAGVSMALDLVPTSDRGRALAAAADPRRTCYAVGR
jgi:gamma-glutamyltranspeptidase/glutathione hydrolase